MAHLSGAFLIDCPASALNNFGSKEEGRYDNWSTVKYVRSREGYLPYVSAQAFRYWMRESLQAVPGWTPAPIFREDKIAYTDANPIEFAEDDLFGYMRAPGSSKEVEKQWAEKGLTGQEKKGKSFVTLTRVSPFKVSTLISIAPLKELGFDYGTMSRGEGDPVPHVHEFYRTTLLGMFSIDLRMMGRFYHVDRTGYRHLDAIRVKLAEERGLTPYDNNRAFELDLGARKARLRQLLEGLAHISGGAKQALHYTDVAPKLLFMAVAKGGNHLFGTAVGANKEGTPKIQAHALKETASVFKDDLLSPFYLGLAQGYLDEQRPALKELIDGKKIEEVAEGFSAGAAAAAAPAVEAPPLKGAFLGHPVEAIRRIIEDLDKNAAAWLA
jgi:CRISPR-associated protein Cst2